MTNDGEANLMLAPEEVAKLLRVEPADVRGLLEDGSLAGLRVAGQWRVPWPAVETFLARGMEREQRRALARKMSDPRWWADAMASTPEETARFDAREFEDGTAGALVKEGLRLRRAEAGASGNVVPIDGPRRA